MRVKNDVRRWCCFSSSTTALLEVGREDVAHDAHGQVGLLEDHAPGATASSARLTSTSWSLCRYMQLALEVRALGAVRRGADDRAAAAEVEAADLLAQPLALLVVEALGDADALARRGVDHVAAGDRQLHRQARALRLQRVLDDLDDDLLAGLEQVGDLLAALLAAAAPRRLDAGQHDLVDVQEAVLVEADVDERRLEAGQDVVDLALVDVADDRPLAAALEVQLGDRGSPCASLLSSRAARRGSPRGRRSRALAFHVRRPFLDARACTWMDWRSPTASSVVSTDEPP